jgi:hypothetical protein
MKINIKKKTDTDKGKVWVSMTNADKIELLAKRLKIVDDNGLVKHADDWLDDLERRLLDD